MTIEQRALTMMIGFILGDLIYRLLTGNSLLVGTLRDLLMK